MTTCHMSRESLSHSLLQQADTALLGEVTLGGVFFSHVELTRMNLLHFK